MLLPADASDVAKVWAEKVSLHSQAHGSMRRTNGHYENNFARCKHSVRRFEKQPWSHAPFHWFGRTPTNHSADRHRRGACCSFPRIHKNISSPTLNDPTTFVFATTHFCRRRHHPAKKGFGFRITKSLYSFFVLHQIKNLLLNMVSPKATTHIKGCGKLNHWLICSRWLDRFQNTNLHFCLCCSHPS